MRASIAACTCGYLQRYISSFVPNMRSGKNGATVMSARENFPNKYGPPFRAICSSRPFKNELSVDTISCCVFPEVTLKIAPLTSLKESKKDVTAAASDLGSGNKGVWSGNSLFSFCTQRCSLLHVCKCKCTACLCNFRDCLSFQGMCGPPDERDPRRKLASHSAYRWMSKINASGYAHTIL
jgi:hypothetical protein